MSNIGFQSQDRVYTGTSKHKVRDQRLYEDSELGVKKCKAVLELLQANQTASNTIPALAQLHTEITDASSQQ